MGSKLNTTKQENKMENNTDTTFNGKEILGSAIIYNNVGYDVGTYIKHDCVWLTNGPIVNDAIHITLSELLKDFKSGIAKFAEVERSITFNGKEILGSTIMYGGIRYNVSLANYDCLWLARAGSNVKNGTHSTIIELLKKFKSGKAKFVEV